MSQKKLEDLASERQEIVLIQTPEVKPPISPELVATHANRERIIAAFLARQENTAAIK